MQNNLLDYERKPARRAKCVLGEFMLLAGVVCFIGAFVVPMVQVAASWTDVRNRHALLLNAAAILVGSCGLVMGTARVRRIWNSSPFLFIVSFLLCCGGIGMGLITFANAGLLQLP